MKTFYLLWSIFLLHRVECSLPRSLITDIEQDFDDLFPPSVPMWPAVKGNYPYKVQSPTDIQVRNAELVKLSPLVIHFFWVSPTESAIIKNTGYYLEVYLCAEVDQRPYITGGPLIDGKYVFEQMHFHWGEFDSCGSEHHIDGICFPAEVHVVFFRKCYGTFEKAMNYPDGVAVLAYLARLSPYDNPDLVELINEFPKIIEPESSTRGTFEKEFKFLRVMFKQHTYYAFPGSLTTPLFSECVTWILCPTPFDISPAQLHAFRTLKGKDGNSLTHNDREIQPFGTRPIIEPAQKKKFQFTQEILFDFDN